MCFNQLVRRLVFAPSFARSALCLVASVAAGRPRAQLLVMRKQAASDVAALPDQDELETLVQRLTQVAGGKQDRNPSQGAGQEVTPDRGYVE